jgi:hypothetical protein
VKHNTVAETQRRSIKITFSSNKITKCLSPKVRGEDFLVSNDPERGFPPCIVLRLSLSAEGGKSSSGRS